MPTSPLHRALAAPLFCLLAACGAEGTLDTGALRGSQRGAETDAAEADTGARPDALRPGPRPEFGPAPATVDARDTPAPPNDAAPGPNPAPEVPDAAPAPTPDAGAEPPPPRPLFIAVISDLNGSYGDPTYEAPVHTAVRRIVAVRPDLVLCAGDMVAGQQAGLDYRAMWRGFHDAVSDPLAAAGIPLAVSPGNHDASGYGGFEEERRIYADEWSARRPAVSFTEDADYPFRYAFTVGEALFVALDDTLVGQMRPAQRGWVGARLAERADLPAKIVFGHVPIHPFTQGRESEILDDSALEDLLIEQGVTAFISGHHHGYFPGRYRGLRQVSMPCLGSGPRALVGTQGATPRGLVFLRIQGETITELDGYTGADLTTRIERASLPERVGVVRRDDL